MRDWGAMKETDHDADDRPRKQPHQMPPHRVAPVPDDSNEIPDDEKREDGARGSPGREHKGEERNEDRAEPRHAGLAQTNGECGESGESPSPRGQGVGARHPGVLPVLCLYSAYVVKTGVSPGSRDGSMNATVLRDFFEK